MAWLDVLPIYISFPLGFVALVFGAGWLVSGAAGLARRVGMSPLVVGLTVVAFGTSAPELAVSVASVLRGEGDLALGNVVGSNITNVLLILGLAAVVAPLVVRRQLLWLDLPAMIGVGLLAWILSFDGSLGRIDGIILVVLLLIYVLVLLWQARRQSRGAKASDVVEEVQETSVPGGLLRFAVGMTLTLLGTHWLVTGAISIAEAFNVSELVIGLTIVSLGSSLPELATSVVAGWKGQRDIAVGNVVGSNIFNILCVLGITSTVAPSGLTVADGSLWIDFPVMLAVLLVCLPLFYTGLRVARGEGAWLLGLYVLWTAYLVLDAKGHARGPRLTWLVWAIIGPASILGIGWTVVVAARRRRRQVRRVKKRLSERAAPPPSPA